MQDEYIFGEITSAAEIELSYPTTILPPKKVLLPQRDELFIFKENGKYVESSLMDQPTVIMGIHTCDMHAIALLDRVFSRGFADQQYLTRRENTTLVSIECLEPCSEHAFCKDMGTLTVPDEFDLHLTDLGDDYAIDIGSEKGAALLQGFEGLRDAADADCQRVYRVMGEKWPQFPYRLEIDLTELPGLLSVAYRSTLWEKLGQQCLGCGVCTLVCPTCYCFDVLDEVEFSLNDGSRLRVWDSCQHNQFSVVAGGHNFRADQGSRQRHRFFRKYKYLSETYGFGGCVGCGRCSKVCLVNITPIEVLNKLDKQRAPISKRRSEVLSI